MVSNLLPGTPAVAGLVPPPVDAGRHGQARFTSGTAHSSPPLPQLLAAGPTELTEYGLSTLSVTGRLGDREVLRRLGWAAGTRLEMREHHGLIVVTADPRGVFRVSGQGFLILPAVVRRWCRLRTGDRVLLVADPDASCLVIHPPASLAVMVSAAHAGAWGGEAR
jgi:bifunctional DNA-binding transcriptional regulator/antitoxin component of YhaV-PrlF toxin-antitoxin module